LLACEGFLCYVRREGMEFENWSNRFIWHLCRSQDVKEFEFLWKLASFLATFRLQTLSEIASLSVEVNPSPLFEKNQAGLMFFCQNLLCFTLLQQGLWRTIEVLVGFGQVVLIEEHIDPNFNVARIARLCSYRLVKIFSLNEKGGLCPSWLFRNSCGVSYEITKWCFFEKTRQRQSFVALQVNGNKAENNVESLVEGPNVEVKADFLI